MAWAKKQWTATSISKDVCLEKRWQYRPDPRRERRKFADVIVEQFDEILNDQFDIIRRLGEIGFHSLRAEEQVNQYCQHHVPLELIVAMQGTTWYVEVPKFEYVETFVEVPKVVFVEKIGEQTLVMPSARDNANSGEMGRDGAPSCEAGRVSSEDKTIKEAEATLDGLLSSILTKIDLLIGAKDETSYIGLALNTFGNQTCTSTFPNASPTKLWRAEVEQRYEFMHRYCLWRSVRGKLHNGTGDPQSKTDEILELTYALHKLWPK